MFIVVIIYFIIVIIYIYWDVGMYEIGMIGVNWDYYLLEIIPTPPFLMAPNICDFVPASCYHCFWWIACERGLGFNGVWQWVWFKNRGPTKLRMINAWDDCNHPISLVISIPRERMWCHHFHGWSIQVKLLIVNSQEICNLSWCNPDVFWDQCVVSWMIFCQMGCEATQG